MIRHTRQYSLSLCICISLSLYNNTAETSASRGTYVFGGRKANASHFKVQTDPSRVCLVVPGRSVHPSLFFYGAGGSMEYI